MSTRKVNYQEEMKEIKELREQGFKLEEIAEITGIPRGTIACRLSRENAKASAVKAEKVEESKPKEAEPTIKPTKTPSLYDFQPRDMIKHLYNLGYRIKDNGLYVMTLQKVNIQSVINE